MPARPQLLKQAFPDAKGGHGKRLQSVTGRNLVLVNLIQLGWMREKTTAHACLTAQTRALPSCKFYRNHCLEDRQIIWLPHSALMMTIMQGSLIAERCRLAVTTAPATGCCRRHGAPPYEKCAACHLLAQPQQNQIVSSLLHIPCQVDTRWQNDSHVPHMRKGERSKHQRRQRRTAIPWRTCHDTVWKSSVHKQYAHGSKKTDAKG